MTHLERNCATVSKSKWFKKINGNKGSRGRIWGWGIGCTDSCAGRSIAPGTEEGQSCWSHAVPGQCPPGVGAKTSCRHLSAALSGSRLSPGDGDHACSPCWWLPPSSIQAKASQAPSLGGLRGLERSSEDKSPLCCKGAWAAWRDGGFHRRCGGAWGWRDLGAQHLRRPPRGPHDSRCGQTVPEQVAELLI